VHSDIIKAELEEKQFKVKLTVVDTPGFGDYVNNKDSWMPIIDFIDDQHESYMRQEQQPSRNDKVDMRIHACLYFIRPTGHTLKPIDIEVMKRLGTRLNLIPVVAKADTLTPRDLDAFKRRVRLQRALLPLDAVATVAQIREVIAAKDIRVYSAPVDADDEASADHARLLMVCCDL
jgi:cell division control protein 12